jgi:hypothetical protein
MNNGEGLEFAYLMDRPNISGDMPEIVCSREDRQLLRDLGARVAEIGSLPIQDQRKKQWQQLNDLTATKPMVWLNDICWNEMDIDGTLTLQTTSRFSQSIETELRQRLYWWQNMPGDMVVDPVIHAPLIVQDTGIGLEVEEEILATEEENAVVSHEFHKLIKDESDIEMINMPTITHDTRRSEEAVGAYREILDGVLDVQQRGFLGFNFSPWDHLVRLTGVEDALLALALRPDFVHKLVDRLTTAGLHAIDQLEEQNLFSLNNRNVRVGSGAYGYTGDLPGSAYDGDHVRTADIWVFATAQIFAEVSPAMHEEFALTYERRVLERFGLAYYGCCEPLFRKMPLMRTIPNLRKISLSPWNDVESMAEQVGRDYVVSLKPNPEILARDAWDSDAVREDLDTTLRSILRHGCNVEIIMKDISTVRHEPRRLWDWTKIATELCEQLAQDGVA